MDFYQSYTDLDTFNFVSAQVQAINKDPKLAADINRLDFIYFEGEKSLLDDPKAYLSRLQSSASPWPKPFSKDILSHANGVLLGYKSIVSVELLNAKDVPSVTPGIKVTEGAGGVGAPAATGGAAGATSTSKAMGMPAATGNPQLVIAAAAAAAGMLGIIAL